MSVSSPIPNKDRAVTFTLALLHLWWYGNKDGERVQKRGGDK